MKNIVNLFAWVFAILSAIWILFFLGSAIFSAIILSSLLIIFGAPFYTYIWWDRLIRGKKDKNKIILRRFIAFGPLLIAILLGINLLHPLFWDNLVEGPSMEPTLKTNDRIIAITQKPKIGDIVLFLCSQKCDSEGPVNLVKRVVKIDDRGCYWVEGDNKEHSDDSRRYGWLCTGDYSRLGIVRWIQYK